MLTLLYFTVCIVLASIWLGRLWIHWYRAERYAAAVAVGFLVGTWIDFLWSILFAYSISFALSVGTILAAGLVLWRLKPKTAPPEALVLSGRRRAGWIIATALPTIILVIFNWNDLLRPAAGSWYSGGSSWGDLALHTSLITHFASRDHLDLSFSLVDQGKLTYHFMIDFLSSLIYRDHVSLRWALLIPGVLLSAAIVQLLFFLPLRLFKSVKAAALATYLFLFGGSAAGVYYLWQDWTASHQGLLSFLTSMQTDYTTVTDHQLTFSNVITAAILPQRSSLFGFSIFLLGVIILVSRPGKKALVTVGVLTGLLPLAHLHTMLALMLVIAGFAAKDIFKTRQFRSPYLLPLIISGVLAVPQVWWLASGGHHTSFVTISPGWTSQGNIIWFWARNLGVGLIFLVAGVFYVRRRPMLAAIYWPLVLLFVIANIVQFQPSAYDNIKLLYYSYLGICLVAAGWLVQFSRRNMATAAAVIVIALAWTITGLSAQLREWNTRVWQLEDSSSIAAAQAAERIIPPDALVLTDDDHANPIPALAGRHILLGYEGWINSYGIDFAQLDQDARTMLAGQAQTPQLLRHYGISYVAIDATSLPPWQGNVAYYTSHYRVRYHTSRWTIVEITPAASQVQ